MLALSTREQLISATTTAALPDAIPGRIRGLDGLRGVAVLAVVLYHLGFAWIPGGFLGVSTFFTLSGFVITRSLLTEHDLYGDIDMRGFYLRRLRRLAPASLATVSAIVAMLFLTHGWTSDRGIDAVAGLAQLSNWRQFLSGNDYGSLFGEPSPFKHLWSLAIEEQFYLIVPVVLIATLRRGRRAAVLTIMAMTAISLFAAQHGQFTGRYVRTDVRALELLAGCLMAFFETRCVAVARRWPVLGTAGLVGFVGLVATVSITNRQMYNVVLPATVLVSAFLIVAGSTSTNGAVSRLLRSAVLVGVGRMSYSLYLVHWPVIVLVDGLLPQLVWIVGAMVALFFIVERRNLGLRALPLIGVVVATGLIWSMPGASVSASRAEPNVRTGGGPRSMDARTVVADVSLVESAPVASAGGAVSLAGLSNVAPVPDFPVSADSIPVGTTSASASIPVVITDVPVAVTAERSPAPTTPDSIPTTPASIPTTPAPTTTTSAPRPPLKMLVAGDSTAEFLGRGLEQRPELNVTNLGNRGCAFLDSDPPVELQDSSGYATWGRHTTGKNCDWRTYLPAAPTDFDVAVVFAAPTMLVNIELPDGSRVSVADPRGREFLRSSLARLSVELRRHARRVVWMTAPTSQYAVGSGPWLWSDENRTVAWNALVVETARATGGSLIDFRSWFMAQPDNDQFRPDGAHLEGRGAELAAEWLATEVLAPTP